MNTYAFYTEAKAKSGKNSLFCWFSAKSDSRAELELAMLLDDADIETGRGADYKKPVRTNLPVVDDLPAERALDDTWCDRYSLNENSDWMPVTGAPQNEDISATTVESETTPPTNESLAILVAQMQFRHQILAQFISDQHRYQVTEDERKLIHQMELDTDHSYAQNLMLAAENVTEVKTYKSTDLWKLTNAVKKIFPLDGKVPELNSMLQFIKAWAGAEHIDRGGKATDRNPELVHTLDTLDLEIALATLPMDFNIYDIPGGVYRRAKEIKKNNESPFKEWSAALRKTPGVLDYSRAAIFALIRNGEEHLTSFPDRLRGYISANLTESDHEHPTPETLAAARHTPDASWEKEINDRVAAEHEEPKQQPEIENIGNGIFSIDGLMGNSSQHLSIVDQARQRHVESIMHAESSEETGDVQMEEDERTESEANDAVSADESVNETGQEADPVTTTEEVATPAAPAADYPAVFEPGRYEGIPNDNYHAANGISSTQVKDARISLMYYHGRHIAKTIPREISDALTFGSLVHTLALEPEKLEQEYAIFPGVPEGALSTTAEMKKLIEEFNSSLPTIIPTDEIKAQLEAYNASITQPLPLSGSVEELGNLYMQLPEEFQNIPVDGKHTATAIKACVKEYNATLPASLKTSGSRDALLTELARIEPELAEGERAKQQPYSTSGNKDDLEKTVRAIKPDSIFADEFTEQWNEANRGKELIREDWFDVAKAMQQALYNHPSAGRILQHPARAVEVSYFGFDMETGLEVRIRPDVELEIDNLRIAADLKTVSMGRVKQDQLRAKLHREIIDRDYHLSAAMYSDQGDFDQFFWIFVNKEPGYHWVAVIEASADLLELGMLEYRKTMRALAQAYDNDIWSAPITEDYTDELNDFDMRRLEALRTQA